jgi:7,8-dihydropterin-6-yl-methyl-4-(beta-D-ribofuranosyl)aminobenzene 5'-phosphate synthase
MGNRFALRDGKETADIILDDQSLFVHTAKGILIVLGCAHAGMVNVMNHAVAMSGVDTIYGVVGGTHIDFSGPVQLEQTLKALKDFKMDFFIPSHCTGPEAAFRLKAEHEDIFRFSHVGLTLEF